MALTVAKNGRKKKVTRKKNERKEEENRGNSKLKKVGRFHLASCHELRGGVEI
jgi:hypothetical protein